MKTLNFFSILLLLIASCGCHKENTSAEGNCKDCLTDFVIIKNNGNYDACGWVLYSQKGITFYKSVKELPQKFKKENEKIKITYKVIEQNYPCGFEGNATLIDILKFEK